MTAMPAMWEEAPETWEEVEWPEWVPQEVRDQIVGFWTWHGPPAEWALSAVREAARHTLPPKFGETVLVRPRAGPNGAMVCGRWIHAWNNMGRVVRPDGTYMCPSYGCVIRWAVAA